LFGLVTLSPFIKVRKWKGLGIQRTGFSIAETKLFKYRGARKPIQQKEKKNSDLSISVHTLA
jgi:hypothetical protein